jgi:hypothetical protein
MANQYLNLATEVFTKVSTPLTFNETWEKAVEFGIDKKLRSEGKTPWQSLGAQLFVDVRDNPDSFFVKIGKRPARFFPKNRQNEIKATDLTQIEIQSNKKQEAETQTYSERDLHPILSYFVYSGIYFGNKSIHTKTIFHEKSKKAGLSEWVYPDLVGFYLPINDWEDEVIEFNKMYGRNILKLYSFELKKHINRSNYREAFFQAVSNSSWAHEGYLACAKLKEDEDLYSELERLSQSFGIGIIVLDLDDMSSSKVLFPAHVKESLDWDTVNKLCEENPDIKKFIQDVKIDFESKRIHQSEYDKIEENIDLYIQRQIQKKKPKQ